MPKQTKWLAECWRIYPTPWRVVHRSRRAMIVAANGNEFMNGINIGKADLIVEAINALGRSKKGRAAFIAKVGGGKIDLLDAVTSEPRTFNPEA